MDKSGPLRVLELFTYKPFCVRILICHFFSFQLILSLIICLDRQANNILLVVSEVYHNLCYIMKYDIKF